MRHLGAFVLEGQEVIGSAGAHDHRRPGGHGRVGKIGSQARPGDVADDLETVREEGDLLCLVPAGCIDLAGCPQGDNLRLAGGERKRVHG